MVDISHKSDLLRMDHDRLMKAVDGMLGRHEELDDWTILYTPQQLGVRYPDIDFYTASTLAKIEDDPNLLGELRESLGLGTQPMPVQPAPVQPSETMTATAPMAMAQEPSIGRWADVDPNRLSQATDRFLGRHEELDDWTDLHSPQELQAAYPNVGYGTASTLAKIEADPALSEEFDRSVVPSTSDAVAFMRSVPLPTRPEQQSNINLPMPDPGIDPSSGTNPMGPGIGM